LGQIPAWRPNIRWDPLKAINQVQITRFVLQKEGKACPLHLKIWDFHSFGCVFPSLCSLVAGSQHGRPDVASTLAIDQMPM